jgi:hypothetical protein
VEIVRSEVDAGAITFAVYERGRAARGDHATSILAWTAVTMNATGTTMERASLQVVTNAVALRFPDIATTSETAHPRVAEAPALAAVRGIGTEVDTPAAAVDERNAAHRVAETVRARSTFTGDSACAAVIGIRGRVDAGAGTLTLPIRERTEGPQVRPGTGCLADAAGADAALARVAARTAMCGISTEIDTGAVAEAVD